MLQSSRLVGVFGDNKGYFLLILHKNLCIHEILNAHKCKSIKLFSFFQAQIITLE